MLLISLYWFPKQQQNYCFFLIACLKIWSTIERAYSNVAKGTADGIKIAKIKYFSENVDIGILGYNS